MWISAQVLDLTPGLWLATAVLAIASTALAHARFNHVMEIVAKISGNMVTVKTAKGNVDVQLGDRTELTRNGRTAHLTRVVAEVPEGSKGNMAQSVKIGAAPKNVAVRQSHASHK